MEQSSTALVPATARNDPDRVAAFNRIVREEVARVEDGHVLDLAGLLCPGGTPRERVGGEEVRYDGVHLSPAGSALVWDWMVNELDQLVPPDAIAR
jgi:hypothetical protein